MVGFVHQFNSDCSRVISCLPCNANNSGRLLSSETIVTSVRTVCDPDINCQKKDYNWIVDGFDKQTGKPFRYRCKRVVLATGTTDLSNQLGIPGENSQPDWITHDLNKLELRLDYLIDQHQGMLLSFFFYVFFLFFHI